MNAPRSLTICCINLQGQQYGLEVLLEKIEVAIYSKTNLSDQEKLGYLRQDLKAGQAWHSVETLSEMDNKYHEDLVTLHRCYDRM